MSTGVTHVRCRDCGWSNDGRLVLVDRWITDYPPIPYTGPILELYLDEDMDPDGRIVDCNVCGCDDFMDSAITRDALLELRGPR